MQQLLETEYGYILEAPLLEEINNQGNIKKVKQGEMLMDIGERITHMPLLLSGAIKILREDNEGDELLLYFIERGDTCAMTFSCCMGTSTSEIRAIAESDAVLIMIPIQMMEQWMATYKSWREFVLDSYHTRMMELLDTIDTLAFLKMDERLHKHLQDKAKINGNDELHATHQDIAQDLHTSRVVVSRLLKKLEKEGKIQLFRNKIKVIDL